MTTVCTMIGRLGDGLVLAASLEEDSGATRMLEPQARAKQLLRKLHYSSPARASLAVPPFTIHYMVEGEVVYMAISERGTSQERVFSYLKEVAVSFSSQYGGQVRQATRPYSFIEFDTTLQKLRKSVGGRKRVSGMTAVKGELRGVQAVLRDNIDSVLERGTSLSDLETQSSGLLAVSQEYRTDARSLNRRSFNAKIIAASLVTIVIVLYFFVL